MRLAIIVTPTPNHSMESQRSVYGERSRSLNSSFQELLEDYLVISVLLGGKTILLVISWLVVLASFPFRIRTLLGISSRSFVVPLGESSIVSEIVFTPA
jgi:hypothetical protein